MKRYFVFVLLALWVNVSFSQEKVQAVITGPQEVQKRIDRLLQTKQYPTPPGNYDMNNLVSLGTKIKKDTVSCTLGAPGKKKKKKYKPAYIVRYSVSADKIVAIETPKKKKKRFLVF